MMMKYAAFTREKERERKTKSSLSSVLHSSYFRISDVGGNTADRFNVTRNIEVSTERARSKRAHFYEPRRLSSNYVGLSGR